MDEPNRDDDYEERNPQPEPEDTITRMKLSNEALEVAARSAENWSLRASCVMDWFRNKYPKTFNPGDEYDGEEPYAYDLKYG